MRTMMSFRTLDIEISSPHSILVSSCVVIARFIFVSLESISRVARVYSAERAAREKREKACGFQSTIFRLLSDDPRNICFGSRGENILRRLRHGASGVVGYVILQEVDAEDVAARMRDDVIFAHGIHVRVYTYVYTYTHTYARYRPQRDAHNFDTSRQ